MMCFQLSSQDVHFSYYQFAPTVVNPAFTGAYYGNFRVTAITRGQWVNVMAPNVNSNDGFTTTNLLIDGNLPFKIRKSDWVSAGINLLVEGSTAGVADYKRSFGGLSAAYHMVLSEKKNNILTASIKYGSYGVAYANVLNLITPRLVGDSSAQDQDKQNLKDENSNPDGSKDSANDWTFGLLYTTPVGKSSDLRIGVAFDHLLAPKLGTPPPDSTATLDDRNNLDRRLNIVAQYYTDLTDKMTFNPSVLYQSIGSASNLLFQGLFGYTPNPKKDMTFNFGLGVRLADNMDVPFYLGFDFNSWRVGMAFDANINGLTQATSRAGAYELCVSKIISWQKKVSVEPIFICPRL